MQGGYESRHPCGTAIVQTLCQTERDWRQQEAGNKRDEATAGLRRQPKPNESRNQSRVQGRIEQLRADAVQPLQAVSTRLTAAISTQNTTTPATHAKALSTWSESIQSSRLTRAC